MIAALTVPGLLMKIFTNDPQVIAEGVKYLRIVAWSYILIGITQVYLYTMRSVERVMIATVVYLCSLICNIILNSVFIFGLLGFPAMGIQERRWRLLYRDVWNFFWFFCMPDFITGRSGSEPVICFIQRKF